MKTNIGDDYMSGMLMKKSITFNSHSVQVFLPVALLDQVVIKL